MVVNWKVVFGAGIALLLSGVLVGFVGGGITSQTESAALSAYISGVVGHFILYLAVFAWVGYRQRQKPILHAILAYILALSLALGLVTALHLGLSLPPTAPQPLLVQAIDWAVAISSAIGGLLLGRKLAKSVPQAHA